MFGSSQRRLFDFSNMRLHKSAAVRLFGAGPLCLFGSAQVRRLGWAFVGGWLLGMTILLGRESVAQAAPNSWLGRHLEPPYAPALHPAVVGLLQGLGSVLALLTFEKRGQQPAE
jgi:hypothetical protein